MGETLTADTSGIADSDGLDNATFSYQWVRNDGNAHSDIAGATAPTYTVESADEGKTVKVRVTFTDDGNREETLTSAATALVAAAPQGICDRTPEVRDAIRGSVPCDEVTDVQLRRKKSLWLENREITALTAEDFAGLYNLTYLDLRRNYVEVLPEGVFDDLTSLEKLYLSSTRLREVPDDAFANSPNLEELDLYASPLTRAPAAWFAKRTSLKRVNLASMKLTELPDDPFEGLSNLEWLDLSGNDLTDLPDGTFDGLTNLEKLDLDYNPLNRASAAWFEDLSSLEQAGHYAQRSERPAGQCVREPVQSQAPDTQQRNAAFRRRSGNRTVVRLVRRPLPPGRVACSWLPQHTA